MYSSNSVNIIRIRNPFDPSDHVHETWEWNEGKRLSDYFTVADEEHVVSINGRIYTHEQFDSVVVGLGDTICVCPVIGGGGGGGKGILRIVAMIALNVVAPGIGAAISGALGVTSTVGMALIQAGVSIVGSMVINALMPGAKPTSPIVNQDSSSSSPSYGIDGPKNVSAEGIVVPIVYGTFRFGGNLLNSYVQNDSSTQNLFLLFNLGEGKVLSLSDIELNEQPITNFKDWEVQTRDGSPNQEPIDWFFEQIVPHNVGQRLTTDWNTYNTIGEIDKFRIDFVAPLGLIDVDSTGKSNARTVALEVEYRLEGSNAAWTPVKMTQFIDHYDKVYEFFDPADEVLLTSDVFEEGDILYYEPMNAGDGEGDDDDGGDDGGF